MINMDIMLEVISNSQFNIFLANFQSPQTVIEILTQLMIPKYGTKSTFNFGEFLDELVTLASMEVWLP